MRWLIVSLAAALTPAAAWPQQQQEQPPTADRHPQEQTGGQHDKTYGHYGEEPGTEAASDAKQASDPDRPKSRAPQDERRGSAAASAEAQTLRGTIVKAGPDTLSLRGEDRRVHRLQIDDQTEILRGGKRVDVGELREGEEVRASFDVRGDRTVAKRITVGEEVSRQSSAEVDKAGEDERRIRGESSESDRGERPGLTR